MTLQNPYWLLLTGWASFNSGNAKAKYFLFVCNPVSYALQLAAETTLRCPKHRQRNSAKMLRWTPRPLCLCRLVTQHSSLVQIKTVYRGGSVGGGLVF